MQTRYITIAIVAFVVLAAGYFAWTAIAPKSFSSKNLELAFSYPKEYVLTQHHEKGAERDWDVLVLAHEDTLPPPENSEAPPVIGIVVYSNEENYSLENWVRGSSFSNFKLSTSGELASTTLGGRKAVSYRYSGLYETEAVATLYGASVYLFTVGWINENDPIRQDFQKILQSVKFIQ